MRKFWIGLICASSVLTLSACNDTKAQSTSAKNAAQVEDNQQRLQAAQPAPRLTVSLERANLIDRLERLNSQNMSGYIYLLDMGRVISFYTVKGKVTSLNAYLMAGEAINRFGSLDSTTYVPVEQPDYDGAYGENDGGIFFFTTDGVYVEWNGKYIFSDAPLALAQEPLLTREVK